MKNVNLINEVTGDVEVIEVVCSFEFEGIKYFIYDKNEVDFDNNIIIYLSKFYEDGKNFIVNLSNDEEKKVANIIKKMLEYSDICDVFNLSDKDNYREKLENLYNDFNEINPIEVEGNIYCNVYSEMGLSLNYDGNFLRQVWDCFRLVYNETIEKESDSVEKSFVLDNFDEIFDNLSKKVEDVDKYIDSLNMRKKDLESVSVSVSCDRDQLMQERNAFESYKMKENERLIVKEKELDEKLEKVNNLLKILDSKVDSLFKES